MKKVVLRRSSARYLAFGAILFTALLFLYYGYNTGAGGGQQQHHHHGGGPARDAVPAASRPAPTAAAPLKEDDDDDDDDDDWQESDWTLAAGTCPSVRPAQADVDTVQQFKKFDFQPYWMKSREYWDANFEERYKARKEKWPDLPLKVILVPHSHNDPGWLKTYESYYHYQTRNILNNMVDKLQAFPNMTFIWSEVSFFAQWWESAHPTKRRVVRRLLEQGRLEIMTGGWVMTDEATVHMYAMLDQLIEGHLWVKNNLGVVPRSGWSVDPFGHGSTVPYMLRQAGVSNTVIQRVHYAWKQWLAQQQMGDFLWRQNWDEDGHTDILTHNQPFDIYSIKHSCGPHPQVCLNFDFRKIPGEYTEYSLRAVPIDEYNVRQKAELLLEQYGRTGSLFPHNVVMMPLGDDFRYDHEIEWDQQYHNYKRLFDYINQNKERYHAEVTFGTPSDYFTAVKERSKHFPTLKGDFYVYSDIFSEGRPAYWSGYFTTRPYWKILDREVEASLRSAEILYTLALNRARQHNFNKTAQLLERDFERIIKARRSLALFQHHDAITGTSKAFVMHDYGLKLFEALQDTMHVQSHSAQTLLVKDLSEKQTPGKFMINRQDNFLLPDTDRESYEKLPQKLPLMTTKNKPRHIVLFNPLAQQRQEVVKLRVTMPNVRVIDSEGNAVQFQINPVWNFTTLDKIKMDNIGVDSEMTEEQTEKIDIQMSKDIFEVMFIATLPGLSLVTYTIERVLKRNLEPRAIVYCASCGKNAEDPNFVPPFVVKGMQAGDIQLENHRMKLLVDGHSGFLKAVTRKATGHTTQCGLQFSAYPSAQFHSGAYLFMPDPNAREAEREVLSDHQSNRGSTQIIIITSGPVASELTVVYHPLLTHSIRIYHTAGPLSEGMYIENTVDFEAPPKNRETELFMRVVSDISNGDPPEFYSDLNGFQMQRREKVERIGIEGNYFPVTSMAYIQDAERRLSLLVSHAQGAAGWQPGWLEVMLDRRTLYDDSRGMGEGVVDNKRMLAKFWLLLEEVSGPADEYSRPSLFAHHLSNGLLYPASLFVVEGAPTGLHGKVNLLTRPFPCDVHLVTLRTTPDPGYMQFPSGSALMVLHRVGYSCSTDPGAAIPRCSASDTDHAALRRRTLFRRLRLQSVVRTSLTGLHAQEKLDDLEQVLLRPMQLVTLNVTFVL